MSELSAETMRNALETQRVFNVATARAQEESRRLGVPNVYEINGHTYYELPDGTLSLEDPWQGKNTPPEA